ncbi:hypothetical protein GCM10027320_40880 [Massilia solisilvae]
MHDVAERIEVGVLVFELVAEKNAQDLSLRVPDSFKRSHLVEKLLIDVDGVTAESGVLISTANGDVLVAVAGAYPYTVTFFATGLPGNFEPEYPLEKYRRTKYVG